MFEYDPGKSAANLAKHGIDFEQAQAVWNDRKAIRISARSNTEPRFAVVGAIDEKLWAVFVTMRSDAIRIISARRARASEAKRYEAEQD